jgi:peptide-methionine (R)-S-oxide reductase
VNFRGSPSRSIGGICRSRHYVIEMTSGNRRTFLNNAAMLAAGVALVRPFDRALAAAAERFALTRSEAEWRKLLSPAQYRVLREEETERPWSSPLNKEKRKGHYLCAGCSQPLFSSTTKFESGTGWPSFYAPLRGAVASRLDRSLDMVRTEVHCGRCGGHLGHIFDDGPKPTGKRYCINGLALKFSPA